MSRFDKNTIPEKENKVYRRINIIEKYLQIKGRYSKIQDVSTFKKPEILKLFKALNLQVKYINGGAYVIDRIFNDYKYQLSFIIRYNVPIIYLYIYENENLIGPKVTNLGFLMNYYDYDENLINKNFGLNNLDDLKNYIEDIYGLFNEFVDEYIKEIDAGNV